jgi:hypothetical protein
MTTHPGDNVGAVKSSDGATVAVWGLIKIVRATIQEVKVIMYISSSLAGVGRVEKCEREAREAAVSLEWTRHRTLHSASCPLVKLSRRLVNVEVSSLGARSGDWVIPHSSGVP